MELLSSAERARLKEIIATQSFRTSETEFTLTSGKKSKVFLDLKATMLDPEGAWLSSLGILEAIGEEFPDAQAIGGLELGAVPTVSQACALSHKHGKALSAFVVRKATKAHGTQKRIEGSLAAGTKVVVFDDVTTTGGSTIKAIEAVHEASDAEVIGIVSLVDRQEGAHEAFKAQYGDALGFRSLFVKSDFTDLT